MTSAPDNETAAAPAVALFIFFQRQFISTNIGSSVKG